MKRFAKLIVDLQQAKTSHQRTGLLKRYLDETHEGDKLWALALLLHKIRFKRVNSARLKQWSESLTGYPPWLIEESVQAVGDIAGTIALLLPDRQKKPPKSLAYWMDYIKKVEGSGEDEKIEKVKKALRQLDNLQQYVFLQLLRGNLRTGLSHIEIISALSQHTRIEKRIVMHRLSTAWHPDDGSFHSIVLMKKPEEVLSTPFPFLKAAILDGSPASLGQPKAWLAEWLWGGIRAQVVFRSGQMFLWSEEELLTEKFPELQSLSGALPDGTVVDGQLVAYKDGRPLSASAVRGRLRRKNMTVKQIREAQICILAFDLLEWEGKDLRRQPLIERRARLESLCEALSHLPVIKISQEVGFDAWTALEEKHTLTRNYGAEGLMLKRRASSYTSTEPKNSWYLWKAKPLVISAVLVNAQKNPHRLPQLYTTFTVAVWKDDVPVPVARVETLLPEDELTIINQYIRDNVIERFGPVRTVKPQLVFKLAFDRIQQSKRRKSGYELLYPRITRWCKDKKPEEAHSLDDVKKLHDI